MTGNGMGLDRNRWLRLSPLLDELLDLDPAARTQRLSSLRLEEPELVDELAALLDRAEAVEREGFLQEPPRLSSAAASLAGEKVGAYTVERKLGQGGMGSVWLARRDDGRFEGHVAIKFLAAAGTLAGSAERFAREGSILARLSHPNIARLIDAGVTGPEGSQRYLVLEYIDGEPIDRHCALRGLDVTARVRLFLDVLAAVAHAHNRLILHRDLKPGNILVTRAGEVKLLDFGIAKLLDDTTASGAETELTRQAGRPFTPAYAAPEQVEGGEVTTATDVYSLGVLLYLLLAGSHPTAPEAGTPLAQMRALVHTEPKRLSDAAARTHAGEPDAARAARLLRGDLDNIVAKALKKAPAERYANAERMADDLRRYLNNEPVSARADAPAYVLAKFVRRHRAGVAAGALVVAALAVGLGVALWQAHEARQQRIQAEGLIEFMLGDLRRKLEPVGRLDVLDAVGEKALAYYAAQDAGRLDADSLGRRASALHLIGKMAELRGNLAEASAVFSRAADSTGELMQRFPKDGQRVYDHAQSVFWMGYIARRRGQAADAEASFRQYLALTQKLTDLAPDNLEWRTERAHAGINLGVVYLESARLTQALQSFDDTRERWLGLVDARPELNVELANTFGWIAKTRELLGEFDAAIAAQRAKIEALGRMPGAASNRRVQHALANAGYEVGRLQLCLGRQAPALQAARGALGQLESLRALDPSNMEWLAHLAFARVSLAEAQLASGDGASAREGLERAAAETAQLMATDAMQRKWHITLRGSLLALQAKQALVEARPFPRGQLEDYLAAVERAESAGGRLEPDQVRIVSSVELMLGDLRVRESERLAAPRPWEAAAQRLQSLAARGEVGAATLLAHAHLRLGAVQEARALADRIESSTYRHPAYADLRQRLKHAAGAAAVQQ
jgi:serine/threonine protein kinase